MERKRSLLYGKRRYRGFPPSFCLDGESKSEGYKENLRRAESLESLSFSSSLSSSSEDSNECLDQVSPLLLQRHKNQNRSSLQSRLSFSKNPVKLRKIEEGFKQGTSRIRDERATRPNPKRASWRFGNFENSAKNNQNGKRIQPRPFTDRSNRQRRDPATPERPKKSFTFPRNSFSTPSKFRAHSYDRSATKRSSNSFGSLFKKRQDKADAFLKASARRQEIDSILDNARQMRKAENSRRNDKRMSFTMAIQSKIDFDDGVTKEFGRKGSMEDLRRNRVSNPLPKTNSMRPVHSLTPRLRSENEPTSLPWRANTWRSAFVERPASQGEMLRTRYEVEESDGKIDFSKEESDDRTKDEKVSIEEFTQADDDFAEHAIFE